jgi:hypothetical protein
VTLKVFKLIGPSNDGRRHGRGTYLFLSMLLSSDAEAYFIEHAPNMGVVNHYWVITAPLVPVYVPFYNQEFILA